MGKIKEKKPLEKPVDLPSAGGSISSAPQNSATPSSTSTYSGRIEQVAETLRRLGHLLTGTKQKAVFQWVVVAAAVLVAATTPILTLTTGFSKLPEAVVLSLLVIVVCMLLSERKTWAFRALAFLAVCFVAAFSVTLWIRNSSDLLLLTTGGADEAPAFERDLFWQRAGFYKAIRDEFQPLKADHVLAKRHIWIHYITSDYQVGLQCFLGMSIPEGYNGGTVPLRLVAANAPADTTFKGIAWRQGSSAGPTFLSLAKPQLDVTRSGFDNAFVYRFYPDAKQQSDWFSMATSEFYHADSPSKTRVEHIVILRASDAEKWNPNKYIFDLDTITKKLNVSPLVYATYTGTQANAEDELKPARDVLQMFRNAETALPAGDGTSELRSDWHKVSTTLDEISQGHQFNESTIIFRLEKIADPKNLVCVYRFAQ